MDDRCLLFFVKNPERGKVKSRLAVAIGEDSVVHLYKNLVKQTLSTLRRGAFPFCICFTPRNAEKPIKNWLGREHRYVPQHSWIVSPRVIRGSFSLAATFPICQTTILKKPFNRSKKQMRSLALLSMADITSSASARAPFLHRSLRRSIGGQQLSSTKP